MRNSIRNNDTIDFKCPSMRVNPFVHYAEMRERAPVCQVSPDGFWMINDYDNAKFALKNHRIFSSTASYQLIRPAWLNNESVYIRDYPMIFDDPPQHTQYRQLLRKGLLSEEIDKQIPYMRETVRHLIIRIEEKKTIDFVQDFARPFTGRVVSRFLGIENPQYMVTLHNWVSLLEIPPDTPDSSYIDELTAANRKKEHYFNQVIQALREAPAAQNALIKYLCKTPAIDGKLLSDKEIGDILEMLTLAGYQGPTQFLCHCIIQLAHNPTLLEQLSSAPEIIPDFIEEQLRFNSSAHLLFRETRCPVTLSGITLPAGTPVAINQASANRDPARFPDPDRFDLSRKNLREHIAFGYGTHNCLGATLVRLLTKVALETIVSSFKEIWCPAEDKLPWFYSLLTHGVRELPIQCQRRLSG